MDRTTAWRHLDAAPRIVWSPGLARLLRYLVPGSSIPSDGVAGSIISRVLSEDFASDVLAHESSSLEQSDGIESSGHLLGVEVTIYICLAAFKSASLKCSRETPGPELCLPTESDRISTGVAASDGGKRDGALWAPTLVAQIEDQLQPYFKPGRDPEIDINWIHNVSSALYFELAASTLETLKLAPIFSSSQQQHLAALIGRLVDATRSDSAPSSLGARTISCGSPAKKMPLSLTSLNSPRRRRSIFSDEPQEGSCIPDSSRPQSVHICVSSIESTLKIHQIFDSDSNVESGVFAEAQLELARQIHLAATAEGPFIHGDALMDALFLSATLIQTNFRRTAITRGSVLWEMVSRSACALLGGEVALVDWVESILVHSLQRHPPVKVALFIRSVTKVVSLAATRSSKLRDDLATGYRGHILRDGSTLDLIWIRRLLSLLEEGFKGNMECHSFVKSACKTLLQDIALNQQKSLSLTLAEVYLNEVSLSLEFRDPAACWCSWCEAAAESLALAALGHEVPCGDLSLAEATVYEMLWQWCATAVPVFGSCDESSNKLEDFVGLPRLSSGSSSISGHALNLIQPSRMLIVDAKEESPPQFVIARIVQQTIFGDSASRYTIGFVSAALSSARKSSWMLRDLDAAGGVSSTAMGIALHRSIYLVTGMTCGDSGNMIMKTLLESMCLEDATDIASVLIGISQIDGSNTSSSSLFSEFIGTSRAVVEDWTIRHLSAGNTRGTGDLLSLLEDRLPWESSWFRNFVEEILSKMLATPHAIGVGAEKYLESQSLSRLETFQATAASAAKNPLLPLPGRPPILRPTRCHAMNGLAEFRTVDSINETALNSAALQTALGIDVGHAESTTNNDDALTVHQVVAKLFCNKSYHREPLDGACVGFARLLVYPSLSSSLSAAWAAAEYLLQPSSVACLSIHQTVAEGSQQDCSAPGVEVGSTLAAGAPLDATPADLAFLEIQV